jgi:hypothetical protein
MYGALSAPGIKWPHKPKLKRIAVIRMALADVYTSNQGLVGLERRKDATKRAYYRALKEMQRIIRAEVQAHQSIDWGDMFSQDAPDPKLGSFEPNNAADEAPPSAELGSFPPNASKESGAPEAERNVREAMQGQPGPRIGFVPPERAPKSGADNTAGVGSLIGFVSGCQTPLQRFQRFQRLFAGGAINVIMRHGPAFCRSLMPLIRTLGRSCAARSPQTNGLNGATASGQHFKSPCEPWADADCAKIAPIAGQNPIDAPALRYSRHRPIDQSQTEAFELGIQLQCPGDIGWKRHLIFVACRRIEDLGHQFAHRPALITKEVVDFGENESGHDHRGRRREDLFVFWKARLATVRPGERPKQSAGVGDDGRDQFSISRKSSDSSPSLLFVDSNSSVEGGRRPE